MALFASANFLLSRKPALRSRKMSEIWSNALEAVESFGQDQRTLHQGRRGNDHISVALVLALTVTHYVIRRSPLSAARAGRGAATAVGCVAPRGTIMQNYAAAGAAASSGASSALRHRSRGPTHPRCCLHDCRSSAGHRRGRAAVATPNYRPFLLAAMLLQWRTPSVPPTGEGVRRSRHTTCALSHSPPISWWVQNPSGSAPTRARRPRALTLLARVTIEGSFVSSGLSKAACVSNPPPLLPQCHRQSGCPRLRCAPTSEQGAKNCTEVVRIGHWR